MKDTMALKEERTGLLMQGAAPKEYPVALPTENETALEIPRGDLAGLLVQEVVLSGYPVGLRQKGGATVDTAVVDLPDTVVEVLAETMTRTSR